MCGRYTLALPLGELVEVFDVAQLGMGEWPPHFNIAPTQRAPVVLADGSGKRRMGLMRWGLVPSWAKDTAMGNRMINARAETAAEKPAFRAAFRARRCLVPADGFYEWRRPEQGSGPKTPYHIRPPGGGVMAMAGLWERWRPGPEDQEEMHTFTILTREAAPWIRPLHHRMPVVLSPSAWSPWLDPDSGAERLHELLEAAGDPPLEAREVSTHVNRPGNDDPACMVPVQGGDHLTR
jgi:putative SOS response-associated peptidase YedK